MGNVAAVRQARIAALRLKVSCSATQANKVWKNHLKLRQIGDMARGVVPNARRYPRIDLGGLTEKLKHLKAGSGKIRASVVKDIFGHRTTHYRGPAKNTVQLFTLFTFANLVLVDKRFAITESGRPP